ncbi:MAG: dual specificity protein phosphatase family protein [Acidobacteriota bacterium]|nr:dual specificity protein phosphatase family protein [Acidobacteriota bacterium]
MRAEIYWITDFLAIMPRPRGNDWLEDEIISYKNFGVDILVSLLEQNENYELEIEREEFWCNKNGVIFLNFPITDRQTPKSFEKALEFIKELLKFIKANKKVAIHCRQGIGRSSLIASSILVLQGYSVEDAFQKVINARNCEVPDTKEQIDWVKEFAQKIKNFGDLT